MRYSINTNFRNQLIDITDLVIQSVRKSEASCGLVNVFVPHTTAAITINENSDPDVAHDILHWMGDVIPKSNEFKHLEGNSDAHIKATLVGSSISIPFRDASLLLGTWQCVYFCEFDGPRSREVIVTVIEKANL
ncbi:MAG: secondary thiamine-phosphate synthase enzyme YjbQ [Mesotoga sp.]|uniref:secondary thiamine-phosphate synthase enzyme YjbQ n=1 Tax=Mesotoga sp. TaxID=2053577 RepID=UPI0016A30EED|nr:secondary thiamine-phosphate synthase enzyme YjbQ [Mesotoga sp.]MDD4206860.1 secondary thiamine-phosphate synthase enzyme YjbQ [Mesotoga sp.]MDD5682494.1 secondary thiamine-phosphate synthase enzyme YjbQ [Mesotoga sp.]MDI9368846.1 secondary thiamine-phosphate synthase enzyme YjbQ [Thermotogota bacterium]NLT45646.1 YjbQ family protein [Thermotogaceae bacterium]